MFKRVISMGLAAALLIAWLMPGILPLLPGVLCLLMSLSIEPALRPLANPPCAPGAPTLRPRARLTYRPPQELARPIRPPDMA